MSRRPGPRPWTCSPALGLLALMVLGMPARPAVAGCHVPDRPAIRVDFSGMLADRVSDLDPGKELSLSRPPCSDQTPGPSPTAAGPAPVGDAPRLAAGSLSARPAGRFAPAGEPAGKPHSWSDPPDRPPRP